MTRLTKTVLQQLVHGETEAYIQTIDANIAEDNSEFKDGNVLYKTIPNRTSFRDLQINTKCIIDRSKSKSYQQKHYDKLFEDISDSAFTVSTEYTINTAINAIAKIKATLGDNFYGAILVNTSKPTVKLNPLHPLTAMAITSKLTIGVKDSWKVIIFTYSNKARMDEVYGTDLADTALIDKAIGDLINTYIARVQTYSKLVKKTLSEDRRYVEMHYKVSKHAEENNTQDFFVASHQFLTRGIVIPWYGASIVKWEAVRNSTRCSGINITPMMSANIQDNNDPFGRNELITPNNTNPTVNYKSVCTGSRSNTTLHGLRSLTHSNTLSPYNNFIVGSGALAYVAACNDKSLQIYKIANILKEKENDTTTSQLQSDNEDQTEYADTANNTEDMDW